MTSAARRRTRKTISANFIIIKTFFCQHLVSLSCVICVKSWEVVIKVAFSNSREFVVAFQPLLFLEKSIHRGYFAYSAPLVEPILKTLRQYPSIHRVECFRHSLGGSIAEIVVFILSSLDLNIQFRCTTFGAPNVSRFSDFLPV